MLITNAILLIDGTFRRDLCVRVAEGRVAEIAPNLPLAQNEPLLDLAGDFLLPGFVDVHIHACRGQDTMSGEAAIRQMSRDLYDAGVAAFLPTTMSADMQETCAAVAAVRAVMDAPEARGARVLGVHMEAPFLNPAKAGAQQAACLLAPAWDALAALTGGDLAAVRVLTLAPELPGADEVIRRARKAGITVSIGHSAATAEETHHAADLGATHVTHTFNAQSPLTHRAPGVPGAALVDDRLYAEFIADGVHLHADAVKLLLRCKGAARAVAITDAMEAADMPDGQYTLGGQPVFVRDGQARLGNGTLAGSVLTMRTALENLIHLFGADPADAVRMCTQTPAESIGETTLGRMAAGSPVPLTRWTQDWRFAGIVEG